MTSMRIACQFPNSRFVDAGLLSEAQPLPSAARACWAAKGWACRAIFCDAGWALVRCLCHAAAGQAHRVVKALYVLDTRRRSEHVLAANWLCPASKGIWKRAAGPATSCAANPVRSLGPARFGLWRKVVVEGAPIDQGGCPLGWRLRSSRNPSSERRA